MLEVHWSRNGERWHPHLHCLVEGRYIPKADLSRDWLSITGDSRIVDLRLVKSAEHIARYVAKYASKPLNASYANDAWLLDEAVLALKGKRLCIPFGTWSDVTLVSHPADGEWDNLGSFDVWLYKAANGDVDAQSIVRAIAPNDGDMLIDLARRIRPPPKAPKIELAQMTLWPTDYYTDI